MSAFKLPYPELWSTETNQYLRCEGIENVSLLNIPRAWHIDGYDRNWSWFKLLDYRLEGLSDVSFEAVPKDSIYNVVCVVKIKFLHFFNTYFKRLMFESFKIFILSRFWVQYCNLMPKLSKMSCCNQSISSIIPRTTNYQNLCPDSFNIFLKTLSNC